MSKFIVGKFTDAAGNALAGGTVVLQLSQDVVVSGVGVIVHKSVTVTLDANGEIPYTPASPGPETGTKIFASDECQPSGSYYAVTAYDAGGNICFFEHLSIIGASPIDLSTLAPTLR